MALKKQDIDSLVYRKRDVGSKSVSSPRVVTDTEKNSANSIVSNLMGYIVTAHS